MRASWPATTLLVFGIFPLSGIALGDDLTIYDVQYSVDPSGVSPHADQIHNVVGGIVTYMAAGNRDRVYLQTPGASAWGGICVKDAHHELLGQLQVGDLVTFSNIYIEDDVDTTENTFLQFDRSVAPDVSVSIVGHDVGLVPDPLLLSAQDLLVDPVDHAVTEPYESVIVMLQDIEIGALDLGRKGDNYELKQWNVDHWDVAWGTDYINIDAEGDYHPWIHSGALFTSITGLVEQNTKSGWDYYQLLTRSSADLVPEPSSLLLLAAVAVLLRRR